MAAGRRLRYRGQGPSNEGLLACVKIAKGRCDGVVETARRDIGATTCGQRNGRRDGGDRNADGAPHASTTSRRKKTSDDAIKRTTTQAALTSNEAHIWLVYTDVLA